MNKQSYFILTVTEVFKCRRAPYKLLYKMIQHINKCPKKCGKKSASPSSHPLRRRMHLTAACAGWAGTFATGSSSRYGRKSRGGHGERVLQNLEWANAKCPLPPRFCQFSKFQAPDCLHYKHYNAVKGLTTPWLWQGIHCFPKEHLQYLPNHHLGGNSTFFWRGHGHKIPLRMHQNMQFNFKGIIHFFGEGA